MNVPRRYTRSACATLVTVFGVLMALCSPSVYAQGPSKHAVTIDDLTALRMADGLDVRPCCFRQVPLPACLASG